MSWNSNDPENWEHMRQSDCVGNLTLHFQKWCNSSTLMDKQKNTLHLVKIVKTGDP